MVEFSGGERNPALSTYEGGTTLIERPGYLLELSIGPVPDSQLSKFVVKFEKYKRLKCIVCSAWVPQATLEGIIVTKLTDLCSGILERMLPTYKGLVNSDITKFRADFILFLVRVDGLLEEEDPALCAFYYKLTNSKRKKRKFIRKWILKKEGLSLPRELYIEQKEDNDDRG